LTQWTHRSLFARGSIQLPNIPIHTGAEFAMSKCLLSLILMISLACGRSAHAQQIVGVRPTYDAVTVKENNSLARGTSTDMDDTTFQARNVTLKHLLVNAYGIREGLMFDLPGWASSTRFDIYAKVTDPDLKALHSLSREQRQGLIAGILVDRFHLKMHTEYKTLPVYELVVAKGGPKLTASAVPSPDEANPDAFGKMNVQNTDMTATGVTLPQLAGNLSFPLDRTVVDKTGLTGRYDFRLRWTADTVVSDSVAADAPPNLFMAIQEQLGLKLLPAKGPVETLVIDHVERPSEN